MMEFLYQVFYGFFVAGLPVGIFSFFMIYYAYSKGYLATSVDIHHAFKKQQSEQSTLSKQHKKNLQFFHSKWVTFGGGFYGLIALLTFLVIELSQVINFLFTLESWGDVKQIFTLNALITMFVDSFINMITAAIWFTYWPNEFNSLSFGVLLLVTYCAYRIAGRLAKRYAVYKHRADIG